jgi:hypothetical protein
MGIIAIVLLSVLFVILFFTDGVAIIVCGFPKSDKEYLGYIENLKSKEPYIISGTRIISHYKCDGFISDSISGILCGCYIEGLGMVPRWYKSYSEIKKMYNELDEK